MHELHEYKGAIIVITDRGPMGHEEGAYVACNFGDDWKFFQSQGPLVVNGFENPPEASTKSEALEAAKELVDRDLRDFETSDREFRERQQEEERSIAAQREAMYIPASMREVQMPLQVILDLHNAVPAQHPLRQATREAISAIGSRNSKAHWTRGIRLLSTGDITFDEASYSRAVWRGKQEVRTASAIERFNKLRQEIEFVVEFAASEDASGTAAADAPGTALVALPDYSSGVEQMRRRLGPLNALAQQMSSGLETMLVATTVSPGFADGDKDEMKRGTD